MKTIRRFYFYLLSIISIQVVIWAVVNLIRTIFDSQGLTSPVDWLAGGISFIAVGVPIFWLHWSTVQKDSLKDEEEASSRIRALFLYALPLATGIPITYAVLAILNRLIGQALALPPTLATLGGAQSHLDNLIAIFANLVALVYFWRILQDDWKGSINHSHLMEFRRLHRYIWMIYGLGLIVLGSQQLLRFIFMQPQQFGKTTETLLATGLALILVGVPIWWKSWSIISTSFSEEQEQTSTVRLVVFFILTLLGIGFSLSALGIFLNNGLRWLFQVESWTLIGFIDYESTVLSVLVSMAIVWRYYRRGLKTTISAHEDPLNQAGLRRIYSSLLSFAGMVVSFLGLLFLLGTIIERIFYLTIGSNASTLSNALALLVIGVPLWLRYWIEIQSEIHLDDAVGISARKSLLRRTYLYLALFASVLGTMISSGWWIYGILKTLLDQMPFNFWLNFFLQLRMAILFAIFLVYHLRILRRDGRRLQPEMEASKAAYRVLILQDDATSANDALVQAIHKKSPEISITQLNVSDAMKTWDIPPADLVLLPATLVRNRSDMFNFFLQENLCKILVIPQQIENWKWLGMPNPDDPHWIQDTANAVYQLSEGQALRNPGTTSPWTIVAYVLAGIFLLIIALLLVSGLVSLFSM